MISWTDNLSVGIKEIDDQHKKFLELVNQLHDAVVAKKSHEVESKIIDSLIEYAFYHFTLEERYLDRSNYPHTEQHKKEHEEFVDKIIKFRKEHEKGKLAFTIKMINFMNNWWINHVLNSDKKYEPYIAGINIRNESSVKKISKNVNVEYIN
jgi:hemerythrin